jgi:hypothetical protein
MKIMGFIYLSGGCSLAILVLRALHGNWKEFWEIALYTSIPNVLTAVAALVVFRKSTPDHSMDRVFLVACYLVGVGAGVYFYFT